MFTHKNYSQKASSIHLKYTNICFDTGTADIIAILQSIAMTDTDRLSIDRLL